MIVCLIKNSFLHLKLLSVAENRTNEIGLKRKTRDNLYGKEK